MYMYGKGIYYTMDTETCIVLVSNRDGGCGQYRGGGCGQYL